MKQISNRNVDLKKWKVRKVNYIYRNINFFNKVQDIYFSNCIFKKCKFSNCILESKSFKIIVFENCIFENCKFIKCKVDKDGCLKFCNCSITKSIVEECFFGNLNVNKTKLEEVKFKNVFMKGCKLCGNSYKHVWFEDNCNLMDAAIIDNYKEFDINFINEESYTKFNYGTYIGRYNYKKCNYKNRDSEDYKRIHFSIGSTYMDLGGQLIKNNVNEKYGICFYEGRRAFHRTLKGNKKLLSMIYNITCGYGEKPSRTFVFSLAFIILFAVLYMFAGLETLNSEVLSINILRGNLRVKNLLKLIIYSIYFSTVTFATVGYGDVMVVNGFGMILSIIEIIIGVFMIGIWTSTLVRKMTR